jgi:hypothetical protein
MEYEQKLKKVTMSMSTQTYDGYNLKLKELEPRLR